jgi:hypothetical protein
MNFLYNVIALFVVVFNWSVEAFEAAAHDEGCLRPPYLGFIFGPTDAD